MTTAVTIGRIVGRILTRTLKAPTPVPTDGTALPASSDARSLAFPNRAARRKAVHQLREDRYLLARVSSNAYKRHDYRPYITGIHGAAYGVEQAARRMHRKGIIDARQRARIVELMTAQRRAALKEVV